MVTYKMVRQWLDKIGSRWEELKTTKEWDNLDRILRKIEADGQQNNQIPEVAEALEAFKEAARQAVVPGIQPIPRPPSGCLGEPQSSVGDPR